MVKILNFCRKEYSSAIAHKGSSRFAKVLVSPISTLLYLTVTCATAIAQSATDIKPTPRLSQQSPRPQEPEAVFYGNQILLNGRTLPGAWLQQRGTAGSFSTHLSDAALAQLIGVELLNSSNPARQSIQWFSSFTKPLVLKSLLTEGYRYLDITNFAKTAGWQLQANGNTLVMSTPVAKLTDISQTLNPADALIYLDLDRPTPWQITQGLPVRKPQNPSPPNREWKITLDGIADPELIKRYTPAPLTPLPAPNPTPTLPKTPNPEPLIQQVEVVNNQTIIRLSVPFGLAFRVTTVPNPNRLMIEIRPDAMVERNITWAPGLLWRQQFVNLGQESFPVVWLDVNPRAFGIKLKPIWTHPDTLVGTAPLIQTAQRYLAVAAINGGYFNRNNQLPLGAIRRDGQWLSSPILNRGAIAWNDSGQFYIGRLTLRETLIGKNNVQLPILTLNSGYVQNGIARYTPVWGATYTPLTNNEIIVVVQKNQVTNHLTKGNNSENAVPIPQDGYLLALRGNGKSSALQLPIGSFVRIIDSTSPADLGRYPHIVGAGPLLLQNRQIVLDAKGENFSDAFIAQKAVRSGICTTATGNLIIAVVHNRAGGAGPTLAEHAQLMQRLGCVSALNLDGGSSTSLYLGGQLIDRSPSTAARVHNGIGIFLPLRGAN